MRLGSKAFTIIGLVLATQSAQARPGWISGGGRLAGDADNPWFIQNTEVVKACILVDRANFHVAPQAPDLQHDYIEPVLDFWQAQLQNTITGPVDPDWKNYPQVGTQRFSFGPCADDTDVRFQFGVLTAEQREYFGAMHQDPKDFVSVAVRTDYDPVHLKARGFVYIAADSGELKPASELILDQPWTAAQGQLLRNVLAHEMGHVFGLRHTTDNSTVYASGQDLMSSHFPEAVVSKAMQYPGLQKHIPELFTSTRASDGGFATPIGGGSLPAELTAFLGIPSNYNCYLAQRIGPDTIDVQSGVLSAEPQSTFASVGTITLKPGAIGLSSQTLIQLWLPSQQTVVGVPASWQFRDLPVYPKRVATQRIGTYRNHQGTVERQVIVNSVGGRLRIATIDAKGDLVGIPF